VVADHDGILPRMTLGRLMSTAELCGEVPLILPALRHWSQAAPLDIDLRTALHKWSPDNTMLTLGERKPFRSWRDATIDNRTLPWPNLELSQRFAIRWTGALRIDQPGSYVFATESDDGSRLAIGDVVVDNSGNHAMRIRRMRADLEPGWLPLTLDFAQGGGEAGCRLLWLPPGGTGLVPIPADRLAERADGPAGLVADGFDQTNRPRTGGPNAEQLAYARALPWHLRVQHLTGNELWEANRYPEALTFFRTILEFNPEHHAGRRASQCLLWSDPPEVDGAIALMRKHPDLWANGWELTSTVNLLRRAGRLQEVVDAIGARNSNDILWPYVRGYAALDRGDLRTARDELGKLMGEGGPGDRYMPNAELNLARLDWAVLNRLDGKETDWPEVERGIQRNGGLQPWQELVLDWLSSAAAWEDCVARVPTIKDGEDLYYFQGLVAMTTGDHALAKQRFQEVVTKHPNWMETPTCKALLKWYETQTPESLAKIATAKPIGKPAVKPDKPRPDANDF
jgi:tetratricopeptide (TPR) repeat protein